MIEPIHIQTNILGTTEQAREAQNNQSQLAGTQAAQNEKAKEDHAVEMSKPAETNPDEVVENREEGSGRGRGWLRQRRERAKEGEEEQKPDPSEPGKGERVDFKG